MAYSTISLGQFWPGFTEALQEQGIRWSSSWRGDDLPFAHRVILLQYQIGRFLKRDQLRYWMGVGIAFFIIGLIGFSYATHLVSWCLALFIFTLGEMIIYPAEYLFIDTIAPERLRGSYL